jgi:GST-like protein
VSDLSAFPITARWPARHPERIQLYSLNTPNGVKASIMLEETGLAYEPHLVDIMRDENKTPEFLSLNPNGKIPAIIDPDGPGGEPIGLFESGAILLYLADKLGRFIPRDARQRLDCIQWLFWQMGNLGPMNGQNHHFSLYAPERIDYAIDRYVRESGRLYAVLDRLLAHREYMAGEYSIADMASYPWINPERQSQDITRFPHLARWRESIAARPAVQKAYALAKTVNVAPAVHDAQSRKVLFGQDQTTVR